jgi:hypothetical protein
MLAPPFKAAYISTRKTCRAEARAANQRAVAAITAAALYFMLLIVQAASAYVFVR